METDMSFELIESWDQNIVDLNQLKQDFNSNEMDERYFRVETLYEFGETNSETLKRSISV